ncbi:TonB-dependent receptor [Altererythrobacter sp. MF3-039]|uniref:TonB-dependent receptor n=1 Tax=Altererythrobacter sp. MF3-039 TaxID=3252901 RepID=UPI00390C8AA7
MSGRPFPLFGTSLFAFCAPAAALASGQEVEDDAVVLDELEAQDQIVVFGERLRGQLDVEQAPILELNEADIEAVGATSITDLIAAIAPQTGSARGRGGGRPVFLVSGIQLGSFRELRSYPPEALARVEVLPEEVAQRFGFPPDRRVVNLILKDNYASKEIEFEFEGPDRGDYTALEQEFSLVSISNGGRLNLNLEANQVSFLTEAERDVIQTEGTLPDLAGDPDPAQFRSLVPKSFKFEASANWAKAFLESGSSLSLNANYELADRRSLSGLNSVLLTAPDGTSALRTFASGTPLERESVSNTFSTSGSWNRPLGDFRLTATFDGSLTDSDTRIDRRFDTSGLEADAAAGVLPLGAALPSDADNGFDRAESRIWSLDSKTTLQGTLLDLPAGELTSTLDMGYNWDRIESSDTRSDGDTRLTRGEWEAGVNLVLPVTSRRNGFLDAIGSISLNAQAGINHLSDFGTLTDWSTGLTWSPWSNLDLQVTYVRNEVAPSLGELGNPEIVNLNVPIFDFVNGETVLATIISGGNPDLVAETQSDWRFSANWELPFWDNTRASLEYVRNRSSEVTSTFPVLTPEIEAAFPDRVTRDASGQLLALDRRPVTFARKRANRLVFGLSTRGSFGEPSMRDGAPPSGEGQGRRGAGRGPGGGNPLATQFGRDGRGRYFFSLNHTLELDNSILIAEGGPLLDLLEGDALNDFGQARHATSMEAGMFRNGMGLRLSGRYTGKARIDGSGLPGSSDLAFGDLATLDVRIFADLGRVLSKNEGWLKGFRVSLRADNVFDGRRRATDDSGDVPLRYQPLLIDPTGRYLGIDFRKIF